MHEELPEEENFSDDPEEQLRIENEILKLKIQAELGGDFEGEKNLPPDLENLFLKNVLEFEHKQANAPIKTVFEILDSPLFVKESELSDIEIVDRLAELEKLMEEKGIVVDYAEDYTARLKYAFITEELFECEGTDIDIPGMTMHYVYEDYHPNHTVEIENLAVDFFWRWAGRSFEKDSYSLAREMILDDGTRLPRSAILNKMKLVFEAYERFDNASYTIQNISFELHEAGTGLGYAEGTVLYDAILESSETQHQEGPFKLYVQYDRYWSVFFFEWPGFVW